MADRRILTKTSRTASWTCVSRAASSLEPDAHYRSGDTLALLLVPDMLGSLLHTGIARRLYSRFMAPKGVYEYTIARTKYIDEVLRESLSKRVDQVVIFGAGFDTRALRFHREALTTTFFELDAPVTQAAKARRYAERELSVPDNLVFVPLNFEMDSLIGKLQEAGFKPALRNLYILEGVLMYLEAGSVQETMTIIANTAGLGSDVVFDYVHASVLRREGVHYGEQEILETVAKAGESWQFGLDQDDLGGFLTRYGLELIDHVDGPGLEKRYFTDPSGRVVGRVNGAHGLVRARKTTRDAARP
jgi:methyltransferase (TIGR00027 family)